MIKGKFAIAAIALSILVGTLPFVYAAPPTPEPTPTPVTIPTSSSNLPIIDNTFTASEWTKAIPLSMYIAGKSDRDPVGTAYLIYNPETQIMYVAVQLNGAVATFLPGTTTWVTIDGVDNKVTFNAGPITAGNGFEASFSIEPKPTYYYIIVHVDCTFSGTTSTGATAGFVSKIGAPILVLPEYLLGGLLALGSCFAAFVVFRKLRKS